MCRNLAYMTGLRDIYNASSSTTIFWVTIVQRYSFMKHSVELVLSKITESYLIFELAQSQLCSKVTEFTKNQQTVSYDSASRTTSNS